MCNMCKMKIVIILCYILLYKTFAMNFNVVIMNCVMDKLKK